MAKQTKQKPATKRRSTKKKSFFSGWIISFTITFFILLIIGITAYHYRDALAYYFSFRSKHAIENNNASKVEEARIFQVLKRHKKKVFGFDVSEYQGKINWQETKTVEDTFQLKFVFIRATAGNDKVDSRFKQNWKKWGGGVVFGLFI